MEALEYLPAVLRAEGIERAVLVGHSDGGSIALIHAAHHPQTVACITEAAHIFVEEITLAGIRAADGIYRATDLSEKLSRYHGEKTDQVFAGLGGDMVVSRIPQLEHRGGIAESSRAGACHAG